MSAEDKGRFCASCAKTVTDFTRMQDKDIFRVIDNMKGATCGRFRSDQLNRSVFNREPFDLNHSIGKAAAGMALLATLQQNSSAQDIPDSLIADSLRVELPLDTVAETSMDTSGIDSISVVDPAKHTAVPIHAEQFIVTETTMGVLAPIEFMGDICFLPEDFSVFVTLLDPEKKPLGGQVQFADSIKKIIAGKKNKLKIPKSMLENTVEITASAKGFADQKREIPKVPDQKIEIIMQPMLNDARSPRVKQVKGGH